MARPRRYHEPRYVARSRRQQANRSSAGILVGAALFGAATAGGWAAATPEQQDKVIATAKDFAVGLGAMRARAPQEGDTWRGCDDARAMGTAPIYRGEPGYREGMDGDGDGIACEPYR